MTERERLRAFDRLKEARHVSERYGVSVVVIGCEHCHVSYERERCAGRRETIQDRLEAVRHLLTVHGLYLSEPGLNTAPPKGGQGT